VTPLRHRLIEVLEAEYGSAPLELLQRLEAIINNMSNLSYRMGHDDAVRESREKQLKDNVIDMFNVRDRDV
jgi:hypothetical protein